jgi:hypothetical protein
MMFTVWSNFFYSNRYIPGVYFYGNLVICLLMVLMSIYFFYQETYQMRVKGWKYFLDFWNIIDILPPLLMITIAVWCAEDAIVVNLGLVPGENHGAAAYRDYFQSMNALLMWFKFAYFLRVTDQTGWLVRMIAEVISDLLPFLLVMVISLLAFTDAFLSMGEAQRAFAQVQGIDPVESVMVVDGYFNSFIYSYFITIGQFDTDLYQGTNAQYLCWFYFILSTFFNLIVMLNLLIAIISDTFNRLMQVKE